jgi:hypothetical protein
LNADLKLEAARENGRWNGHLRLKRSVVEKGAARDSEWGASFRGLRARLPKTPFAGAAAFGFDTLVVRPGAREDGRRLVLRRAVVSVFPEEARARVVVRGALCGGSIASEGDVAFRPAAPWDGSATLTDVRVRPLLRTLGMKTPLEGALSGKLTGSGTLAKPSVEGKLRLGNGAFGPHPALTRLEEQTGIALGRISFLRAAAEFVWRPGEWDVVQATCDGPYARLAASFKHRAPGRIAGTLSARFPAHAVRRSSQLGWLMRFVGERDWIDFDFRVAGSTSSPRVQWQGGEFKKRVEKNLAPWMRQILTRELEKRMAREAA